MLDWVAHLLACTCSPEDCPQHSVSTFDAGDGGLRQQLHVRKACNTVNEVARHARSKALPTNQQQYFGDLARQVDYRLPSRIAGPHQCHLLPGTQLCLEGRSPIVHARSLESCETVDRELPIARSARDHD